MSTIVEWLSIGFGAALYAAFSTLPLALLALAIDAMVCRRLGARFRCLLWIVVAARLVMPVAPESEWSLQQVWHLTAADETSEESPPYCLALSSAIEVAPRPDWGREKLGMIYGDAPPFRAVRPARVVSWQSIVLDALPMVWFVVGATLLLRAVVASARFARRLRMIPSVDDQATLQMLRRVCAELGIRRPPTVKYVPGLSAPALFGTFRPTVCLPAESASKLNTSQIRMIMLHELMHVRRRDGLLCWAMVIVQAVQWFNPIAWLAMGRIALYREQACDEAVRQWTESSERATYADLLLRFASSRPNGSLGLVGMWFARPVRHLKARLEAFAQDNERRRKLPRPAIAAILGILAMTGLTDAANYPNDDDAPRTVSEWMSSGPRSPEATANPAWSDGAWTADGEEVEAAEARSYDLSKALTQLAKTNPRDDSRSRLLSLLTLPALKSAAIRDVGGEPNRIEATMTPRQHAAFADMLAAIEEAGAWQVAVQVLILRAADIEAVGNVDWKDAVRFVQPTANRAKPWGDRAGGFGDRSRVLCLSAESTSWEYSPYLAFMMDEKSMRRVRDRLQRVYMLSWPKVTMFSGSTATVRDESQRPFVGGVNYIKGDFATAAQPQIATLTEGSTLDVQPIVVDAGALDLRCRLAVSKVDGVSEVKLPGQNVTVQNPRLSRKTITASCRVAPGETLLIAPMIDRSETDDSEVRYYAITADWFPDPQMQPGKSTTERQSLNDRLLPFASAGR